MRAFSILSFVVVAGITSVSAEAACGGGGYKPATIALKQHEVRFENRSSQSSGKVSSKLDGLQRDIDKAQAKFDRCEGDCNSERRKLEEARAKYARKANEI